MTPAIGSGYVASKRDRGAFERASLRDAVYDLCADEALTLAEPRAGVREDWGPASAEPHKPAAAVLDDRDGERCPSCGAVPGHQGGCGCADDGLGDSHVRCELRDLPRLVRSM